jgi:hypothetical protein
MPVDFAMAFPIDSISGRHVKANKLTQGGHVISKNKLRLVLSIVSVGLLSIVSASSYAGRSVRTDSSDGAFEFLGGFWGSDNTLFGSPGFEIRTQFKLNFGGPGGARYYTVCMSEDGFLRFVTTTTCTDADFALPATGNYIAVFATDLAFDSSSFGSQIYTRGFVDLKEPYRLPQAVPAMRFWWNGVLLADDAGLNQFEIQIVLLDRGGSSNTGNFDIELNYGNGDQVPAVGTESNPDAISAFQGFSLGPNSSGPTFGPFGPFDTSGAPIRFCFRGGVLRATCN